MASLIERHANKIVGVLSCFDRLVIQGTLPSVCHPKAMANELDRRGIRIFDYTQFVQPFREAIRAHAERLAAGWKPLRALYETVVKPIATRATIGAWFRRWRVVTLDGSSLDVADTRRNERAFGRPGSTRGKSGFPQIRFVTLLEIHAQAHRLKNTY